MSQTTDKNRTTVSVGTANFLITKAIITKLVPSKFAWHSSCQLWRFGLSSNNLYQLLFTDIAALTMLKHQVSLSLFYISIIIIIVIIV